MKFNGGIILKKPVTGFNMQEIVKNFFHNESLNKLFKDICTDALLGGRAALHVKYDKQTKDLIFKNVEYSEVIE